MAAAYLAGADPADPRASPAFAPDLSALPPTLFVCGDADVVLEIDPDTHALMLFGRVGGDPCKWYGGVLGPNDKIYTIPYSSPYVLEIDPEKRIVGKLFRKLAPVTRDIFLRNYVEEVIEDALGIDRVLPFIRSCFMSGIGYYLTEKESDAHEELWRYK